MPNDIIGQNLNNHDTLVIIPSYNHVELLKKCLSHLNEQTRKGFSTIIIDNGSNNETGEFISDYCNNNKDFYAMFLNDNTGFAHASNEGFKYSITNNYKYSLLLNNDCYVEKDFVEILTNAIKQKDSYFAINPLMISYKDIELVDDFGDSYNIFGYAFQNKVAHKVTTITKNEKVFSACGGASIYNNTILKEIGLLDENFFCYLEDIDLSYRARIYGYEITTCHDARCYHVGSATSGSKYNDFKVSISARNNIFLIHKNMPFLQIIVNLLPLFIGMFIKQLVFIRKGFGKAYFNGIIEGFKNSQNIAKIHTVQDKNHEPTIGAKNCESSHVGAKFTSPLNYVKIELYLIINTIRYFIEFFGRQK